MDEQLNYAPCGYLSLWNTGVIAEVNQTLLDSLEYEREEVLGQHVEMLMTISN
ncbi:hypothetical protein [Cohnella boryungensis]|uniref:PAS domain-containing protein n=1 Tax=Cohnella boryungensis TaxID=768479 RepID=A0ABV8S9L9_9BACL